MLELELYIEDDPVLELEADVVPMGDMETYEGPYEVTPTLVGFSMGTMDKAMTDDVSVRPIPIQQASNPQGGYTYTIG